MYSPFDIILQALGIAIGICVLCMLLVVCIVVIKVAWEDRKSRRWHK